MSLIEKLLCLLFHHEDIMRGEGQIYLRRWFLYPRQPKQKKDVPRLYLHKFYTGDEDDHLHDHPWKFVSLILKGGYWEHRINPNHQAYLHFQSISETDKVRGLEIIKKWRLVGITTSEEQQELQAIAARTAARTSPEPRPHLRTWFGPGTLLRRGARWTHKVELPEGRTAWTLIRTGVKEREWGFHTPEGFCIHKNYRDGKCGCFSREAEA